MSRSRQKSQGRRGGEAERFAYIPESLLKSIAGQTLPHAALKVLTILIVGRTKERNGTMCCSESYAAEFGITSRATVRRSLEELLERGIIVITRKVTPFKKHATLYGVTWWAVTHRDGEPLDKAEEPTHEYLKWQPIITPTTGVEHEISLTPMVDNITPIVGVETTNHHTHGGQKRQFLHTHHEGKSSESPSVHGAHGPQSPPNPAPLSQAAESAKKLLAKLPHLTDGDIAKICRIDIKDAQTAREAISNPRSNA